MKKIIGKIKNCLNKVGLFYKEKTECRQTDYKSYQVQDESKLREHRDFLVRLQENEDKRLESIDSKTSQLISQTGIIFSLLGLFIPIMMDKASDLGIVVKTILIFLLVVSALFYMLTIHNALRNYRISKYTYGRSGANNVLDFKDSTAEEFLAEEIRDILSCINKNIQNNNRKGTNLLHSYAAFKVANLLSGALMILSAIFILFYEPTEQTLAVKGSVEVMDLKRLGDGLIKSGTRRDTVFISIPDTIYSVPAQIK
jgi:large-conductance mechanosensitive channel